MRLGRVGRYSSWQAIVGYSWDSDFSREMGTHSRGCAETGLHFQGTLFATPPRGIEVPEEVIAMITGEGW